MSRIICFFDDLFVSAIVAHVNNLDMIQFHFLVTAFSLITSWVFGDDFIKVQNHRCVVERESMLLAIDAKYRLWGPNNYVLCTYIMHGLKGKEKKRSRK